MFSTCFTFELKILVMDFLIVKIVNVLAKMSEKPG